MEDSSDLGAASASKWYTCPVCFKGIGITVSSRLNTIGSFGKWVITWTDSIWLDVKAKSDLGGWRGGLSGKEKSSALKLAIEPWLGLKEHKKGSYNTQSFNALPVEVESFQKCLKITVVGLVAQRYRLPSGLYQNKQFAQKIISILHYRTRNKGLWDVLYGISQVGILELFKSAS